MKSTVNLLSIGRLIALPTYSAAFLAMTLTLGARAADINLPIAVGVFQPTMDSLTNYSLP